MSDSLGSAASTAGKAAKKNPLADVAQSEAADRLKAEVQDYLAAQATRLLTGVGTKLGETTGKLNDIAEGNSPGFAKLALDGGRKLAEGKSPMRAAFEVGAGKVKDNVVGAFKNLTGGKGRKKGGGGQKPTVIIEYVDVGVPLRTAYDQWTQYQDFSTFAKGVKSANRADDTSSDWQLKVLWSNRSWKATTTEQVPDDRISWTSEGAKGSTKGVVSFHELAANLTRVVLVIEYYPKGLFEKTGNIWRAQGRRARLDLKNYVRHITFKGEADDGWRGEIRDGEVVRSHEDAVAEEEEERQAEQEQEQEQEQEPEGEYDEEAEGEPEEEYDEEAESEYAEPEEDEAPEEDKEAGEDEYASGDEDEDEYEYEDAEGGSRR
ncbi:MULTISPECIES: SRPBCC family protein [Streptomyces]|uniref:SRPBCC family protein n=1 Tax=Streptomyces rubrogriseus TaxID=194673 RepID=A0ABT4P0J3_9ACTN|nr:MULTISPECIES: SRPBCC family protein [Streptomyces]MCW8119061.1 SRPBCC family protein [Streptomyces anthocyanicus]MCZ4634894.1 SRPBCC family protein [Streptomyces rubrogriseus]MDX3398298.1 SRPBCC family protein [Streptomyces sp. ME01-18h]WSB59807.1 SRPBCC family protein [Streptomyces anthocyanicus]WTE17352.1 SRPBCC family protein [Streptomyces anthocyanicus]